MRIAEYKQIDTEVIENTILVDDIDENGEVIGQHEETVTKEVPVMGMVYRDMTEEEVRAYEEEQSKMAQIEEPTTIDDLVEALDILTNIVLGGDD